MTLATLATQLASVPPTNVLIFETKDGPITAGYHVTEFKSADINSIDCAGHKSSFAETVVQVMDGYGGDHMEVGKFTAILGKCISAVPALATQPLFFEFAHGNVGLKRYEIGKVDLLADATVLHLSETRATCKPASVPVSCC